METAVFVPPPYAPAPGALFPRRRGFQRLLFCPCGQPLEARLARCRRCAQASAHSQRYFDGHRHRVLARDGRSCRCCGASHWLQVHHRRPGLHSPRWLVTLCAGCHTRVHRLQAVRYWLPPLLLELWKEQHPAVPPQLQFDLAEEQDLKAEGEA